MISKVFKLAFSAPVHFGADNPGVGVEKVAMSCRADTLFSALCCEAALIGGDSAVSELVQLAGGIQLSDLFPYDQTNLYIPKPIIQPKERSEQSLDSVQKKQLKKLKYIPIDTWNDYLEVLAGKESCAESGIATFDGAYEVLYPRVSVSRIGEDAEPYVAGAYAFKAACGLYFVARFVDSASLDKVSSLMQSLQYSGIGGERSNGWGKFDLAIEELPPLFPVFADAGKAGDKMTLSSILPTKSDLAYVADGYYTLARREGFVQSATYADKPLKRKALHLINAGSCFENMLEGCIVDVASNDGAHPVYRYGKGLWIAIEGGV